MLRLAIMLFLASSTLIVNAQDLGGLLTQIVDGIKPEAFTKKFNKNIDEWKQQAASLDATDLEGVSKHVGDLINGVKGSALTEGVKPELLKNLGSISKLSDVGKLLDSFISGLDPSMLTGALASNKDMIKSELSKLGS